jgi:hypothetical protein
LSNIEIERRDALTSERRKAPTHWNASCAIIAITHPNLTPLESLRQQHSFRYRSVVAGISSCHALAVLDLIANYDGSREGSLRFD